MRGMSYQCDSGGRAVASAGVMVVAYHCHCCNGAVCRVRDEKTKVDRYA
jgi:hypothetical protein